MLEYHRPYQKNLINLQHFCPFGFHLIDYMYNLKGHSPSPIGGSMHQNCFFLKLTMEGLMHQNCFGETSIGNTDL